VIVIALMIGLTAVARRQRRYRALFTAVLAVAAILATTAFVFTRDTEAILVLAAAAMATCLHSAWRAWWKHDRWAIAIAAVVVLASGFSVASSQVIPAQPVPVTWVDGWATEATTRGAYPLVDNFMMRVMTDLAAKARAIRAGLSWAPELDRFIGNKPFPEFFTEPRYHAQRSWIIDHGALAYVGVLARHPLDHLEELVATSWYILTPPDFGRAYMPPGWRANTYGRASMQLFRGLTESSVTILVLMITCSLTWRRVRKHSMSAVAAVLLWSALVGLFAAYYGDAMEMARHAWGAGQQLILALVLIGVLRLDEQSTTST
jgi:hypothetical protein